MPARYKYLQNDIPVSEEHVFHVMVGICHKSDIDPEDLISLLVGAEWDLEKRTEFYDLTGIEIQVIERV